MKKKIQENKNYRPKFEKNRIIRQILAKIIYLIIAIIMLYNIVFTINTIITKKDYFSICETNFLIMETNLMKPEINKNSLVLVKNTDNNELQKNEIIAYFVNGKIRINKIISIDYSNGKQSYITKSNMNYYPDIEKVSSNMVIGKSTLIIPFLGGILKIIQSKLFTIFVTILLILKLSYNRQIYLKTKERRKKKRESIKRK